MLNVWVFGMQRDDSLHGDERVLIEVNITCMVDELDDVRGIAAAMCEYYTIIVW